MDWGFGTTFTRIVHRDPKILYISSSWPRGKTFGGQLRALHTARALQSVGKLSLLVVSGDAGDEEARFRSAEEFDVLPPICPALNPNRGLQKKLRRAFDTQYLNVHGYQAPTSERERVLSLCQEFDLVWLLNSRTPNILEVFRWPGAHLDIDDIPSTYLRATAQNSPAARERWKARLEKVLMKRRELLFKKRFTTLSVCSEEDRRYLGGGDRIHVIPNGFARPLHDPKPAPVNNPPCLGFIGLYSYAPNLEGVRWFLKNVWPAIRKAVPGIRFRLAGRDSDGNLRPSDPDVDVLGWIDDPASEIATWSAMVVPIQFGGGTRIKLADAFSRKCPVVSTSLGAFGYEVESGRQLRIADSPEGFAQACVDAVRDPGSSARMAESAWSDFLRKWTWDAIAPRVWAAAEDCLRRSERTAEKSCSVQIAL